MAYPSPFVHVCGPDAGEADVIDLGILCRPESSAEANQRLAAEDYDNARRQLLAAAQIAFPRMSRTLAVDEAVSTGNAVVQIASLIGGSHA